MNRNFTEGESWQILNYMKICSTWLGKLEIESKFIMISFHIFNIGEKIKSYTILTWDRVGVNRNSVCDCTIICITYSSWTFAYSLIKCFSKSIGIFFPSCIENKLLFRDRCLGTEWFRNLLGQDNLVYLWFLLLVYICGCPVFQI